MIGKVFMTVAAVAPILAFGEAKRTAVWTSDWTLVTPENGVKDDYYPLPRDAADGSFRFRFSRNADNTIGVEAFVRDDRVVVDDCKPGAITCTTWTDDCLEVFFDGDNDRNPNTRGEDYDNNPTPCNAGGEYAIAANGASQSDYASAKKCFGKHWGGVAEPWTVDGRRVGTHYDLWFGWECLNRPAPKPSEPVRIRTTVCIHDDDDGKACDKALYWKGNPKYPFADESAFGEIELPAIAAETAQEPFSPIVPVMLSAETNENLVKDLRRLRKEFGLKRFILVGPDVGRTFGVADLALYEEIGRRIAAIKDALADTDIRIGWWCDPTFHACPKEPWQRIMDCDGNLTDSICPLDAGHVADFAAKLCAGLRIGRPDPIFIEDDFTLSNHGGMNAMKGCFCPLHMKAYEKKVGKAYSPKEVAEMFRKPTKENESLRQAWADMSRESLVGFATAVRREIDKVAPETRVCQCQSGFVDIDGDSTEAVARAWAGKNRPLARLFGAGYWDENPPMNVAANIAHVFWSAQHLPGDFELLHETDAYPHTRFYNSSLFLVSEFAGAMMAGVHDSYYYCLQYTDDPLSDTGYVARMREFAPRFAVARDLRIGGCPVGVRMVYTPKEAYMVRETTRPASCGMLTASTVFLTKLGFPIVTREDAPVATLFGNTANVLSNDEIRALLAGGLFLDGEAAEILTKRGFADLIGATAADDVETKIEYASERILNPAGSTFRGRGVFTRRMKSKPIIGWTPKHSVFAALEPKPGAVAWSVFCDVNGREVAPAVLYFENALGGRIGVMAQSVDVTPPHMSLYTPRKQELFHHLFEKLSQGCIAVRAPKTPNTQVLASEKDGELLVMVNNLAGEPREDVVLEFAKGWRGGKVERLTAKGGWKSLGTAETATELGFACEPMVPEFIRVTRADKPLTRRQKITADYYKGHAEAVKAPVVRPHADAVPFKLGIAGYTMCAAGLDKALEIMKAVDCHVLCHKPDFLPYSATDAEIAAYKEKLASYGVETVASGPLYSDNEKEIRAHFEFAKRMGLKVVVGVPFDENPKIAGVTGDEERIAIIPPEEWHLESDRVLDIVDRLVKEYDIRYAIHNHGPDNAALFATAEAALKRIGNRDKRIGVCLDVGHERRAGIDPAEFIRKHGDRIYDVHLKNIQINPKYNIALQGPRGELDIPAIMQALKDVGYTGACHIEYERDFDDNLTGVAESVGYYRGCMDSTRSAVSK